jgi:glycosyltransferase involved in cell wall biosynthesis
VVSDGVSGFLVDDEDEMAAAVGRLAELDPERCRAWVAEHFDAGVVTKAHEAAYREVVAAARGERLTAERPPVSDLR